MTSLYLVASLIALGLVVYLFVALVNRSGSDDNV